MKKISDYNCPRYKHTLKPYDLKRTHRVFSKKKYHCKNILRKIAYDHEFIYEYSNKLINKISGFSNQYNRHKRITIEATINYRAFSVEAMYGPEVEDEGEYPDAKE
jgi:hypothetical protein